MKRSVLFIALTTLTAGAALAQSSVTIYGRVNETLERQKTGNTTSSVLQNNSSRIGFKGEEDLGNGLKAHFVLEHGFAADTGVANAPFWGRESTVGLTSASVGTLRLGNMPATEAYYATADWVSMHNHDTGTSSDAFYGGPALANGMSNAIAYTTPSFGGLRFDVQYGLAEGGVDHPISSALNYDQGPLHVGVGYERFNNDKSLAVSGLYTMGAFTFGGYVERNSGNTDRNNFRLSGMLAQGASEFHANVGMAGDVNDISNTGAKQFTLGYNYNLSKRTKVYGFYTKVDNESAADYFTGTAGSDFSSIALGVRHNF